MSCVPYTALAAANIGFQKGGAKPLQATRSKTWSKRGGGEEARSGGGEEKRKKTPNPQRPARARRQRDTRVFGDTREGDRRLGKAHAHPMLSASPGNKAGLRGGAAGAALRAPRGRSPAAHGPVRPGIAAAPLRSCRCSVAAADTRGAERSGSAARAGRGPSLRRRRGAGARIRRCEAPEPAWASLGPAPLQEARSEIHLFPQTGAPYAGGGCGDTGTLPTSHVPLSPVFFPAATRAVQGECPPTLALGRCGGVYYSYLRLFSLEWQRKPEHAGCGWAHALHGQSPWPGTSPIAPPALQSPASLHSSAKGHAYPSRPSTAETGAPAFCSRSTSSSLKGSHAEVAGKS